jgi:hypothetical protein
VLDYLMSLLGQKVISPSPPFTLGGCAMN